MGKIWDDFGNIQETSWGKGTFYPHDSNADDKRCAWIEEYSGWDCPGAWCTKEGVCTADSTKQGAGNYGGRGCHFYNDKGLMFIDQTDANYGGKNLVEDNSCQCTYDFKDGTANSWSGWVQQWRQHAQQKEESKQVQGDYYWFANGNSPQWGVDYAACWMNNPRDMILLQNHLYWQRADWIQSTSPDFDASDPKDRAYWGWNEISIGREFIDDVNNWDSLAIKLPSGAELAGDLDADGISALEEQLGNYIDNGLVKTGADAAGQRPSSYVVFVQETVDSSGNYRKKIYCENWQGSKYKVVHESMSASNPTGSCYLDYA